MKQLFNGYLNRTIRVLQLCWTQRLIALIIFFLIHFNISSQTIIKGLIRDRSTKEVIPYVSIGIFEKSVGAVSNESGVFNITIPNNLLNDTLSISCLGYESQKKVISSLKTDSAILLVKKDYLIEPITISPKIIDVKGREKENGLTIIFQRKSENKNLSLSGGEIAMLFKNSKKIRVREVKFFLAQNGYDTLRIRVNIYNAKKTNVEDRLFLKNSLITITNKTTGWLSLDLSDNYFFVEDDYMIALEIVGVVPDVGQFGLKGMIKPFGKSYVRDVSFGKWAKKSLNLSLNATTERY